MRVERMIVERRGVKESVTAKRKWIERDCRME